jgi:hypothetical protein
MPAAARHLAPPATLAPHEAEERPAARSGVRPRVLPCDVRHLHAVGRHAGKDGDVRASAAGDAAAEPTTGERPNVAGDRRVAAGRVAADLYRAAHDGAGVSFGQTARALGVSPQHVARLVATNDADPRAVTVRDVIAGPASVRQEMTRLLAELDADAPIPEGRTLAEQALRIAAASCRVSEAAIGGDAAAILRAAALLETERRILVALARREVR